MKRSTTLLATLFVVLASVGIAACAPTAREVFGARLDRAHNAGMPLIIYALGVPGEISVSSALTAVPVYVQFVVTSDKPLSRVTFTLTGYTVRGIPVRARDGLPRAVVLIGPGPFHREGNYEINSFHTRPAGFPGGNVACVQLQHLQVLYADGTRKSYDAPALRALLLPGLRSGCADQGPRVNRVNGRT